MLDNQSLNLTIMLNQTMAENFEHINLNEETFIKVMKKEPVSNLDKIDYRIVYQFGQEFLRIMSLKNVLNFNDILKINENIGYKLNLNPGEFAERNRYVSSFNNTYITIPPQDVFIKEKEFMLLINQLNYEQDVIKRQSLIFIFFINEIVEQWFMDGNKRTALIVCNKLLLQYCCFDKNRLLIKFDNAKFNDLLANYYIEKHHTNDNEFQQKLIDFLIESTKDNIDISNLDNLSFEHVSNFFKN